METRQQKHSRGYHGSTYDRFCPLCSGEESTGLYFQGRQVVPGFLKLEVKYTEEIVPGVRQDLGVWIDYMTIRDQSLAVLAEELLDGSPWTGSEYRLKTDEVAM